MTFNCMASQENISIEAKGSRPEAATALEEEL